MDDTSWIRQTPTKPAFEDVLWSRPENRRHAGKLLIVGGNNASFTAVSSAFGSAAAAGIGTARVIMPGSLEKMLIKFFPEAQFVASTPSGSFARTALGPLCDAAAWADGVLLAGDFGKNSETAVMLENFISKYSGGLTLAGDSLDYFMSGPQLILDRPETIIIGDFGKVQKLLSGRLLVKHSMNLAQIVQQLVTFSGNCNSSIITMHSEQLIVASRGRVSTTPAESPNMGELATFAAVWSLQQPGKTFEALVTAIHCYLNQ
ncbi:MAG TPA: hypothetical protein VG964_03390 [Candidatus Saccharimonadales bacterium]|nr:hypothetical protein [Candidatus Saccharimonadales bacterium]